jgi:hypothetical protein
MKSTIAHQILTAVNAEVKDLTSTDAYKLALQAHLDKKAPASEKPKWSDDLYARWLSAKADYQKALEFYKNNNAEANFSQLAERFLPKGGEGYVLTSEGEQAIVVF